jgi:hypothetical protein
MEAENKIEINPTMGETIELPVPEIYTEEDHHKIREEMERLRVELDLVNLTKQQDEEKHANEITKLRNKIKKFKSEPKSKIKKGLVQKKKSREEDTDYEPNPPPQPKRLKYLDHNNIPDIPEDEEPLIMKPKIGIKPKIRSMNIYNTEQYDSDFYDNYIPIPVRGYRMPAIPPRNHSYY